VVAAFGGSLAIREWWEMQPAGDPHTFQIVLSLRGVVAAEASAAYVDTVIAEIRRTKPVRSHFTFTQAVEASGGLQVAGVARPATLARLSLAIA
jgi:P2-related tail formation protein